MDLADLESGSSGPGGGSGGGGSSLRIPLSLLASTSLASVGRLRVLIVGDAGVGKSCIAQRIAGKSVEEVKIMTNLSSTTGCATECKLYQYRGGVGSLPATAAAAASSHGFAMGNGSGSAHLHSGSSLQHRSSGAISSSSLVGGGLSLSAPAAGASSAAPLVFIELWDVSGHRKYAPSRSVFFNSVNALILVFDLMNRKSYENIRKWIKEVVRIDKVGQCTVSDSAGTHQRRPTRMQRALLTQSSALIRRVSGAGAWDRGDVRLRIERRQWDGRVRSSAAQLLAEAFANAPPVAIAAAAGVGPGLQRHVALSGAIICRRGSSSVRVRVAARRPLIRARQPARAAHRQ